MDGVLKNTWNVTSLAASTYTYAQNYSIGQLTAGSHTITITADSSNNVTESSESDNSYTKTITVNAPALPNLTPYQPSGWSDKLVVSTVSNNFTSNPSPSSADTLYVDWSVINNGTVAAGAFTTSLYVDGVLKQSWNSSSLPASSYTYAENYSIGSLTAGTHSVSIVADSGNTVAELNEADNSYTNTFTVTAATAPAPTLGTPANTSTNQSTTPAFTWSSLSGVTGYRILVATSAADLPTDPNASSGGSSVILNATATNNSYTPTVPLNPGTTYYWEVHGRNGSDDGVWSSVSSFTTGVPLSGLTIIPSFDSSITSDPQAATIESTINAAIAVYQANFSDPVTVNITFKEMSSGLGQSSAYLADFSYSSYRSALLSHATTTDDATALANLPSGTANPVTGDPNVQLKLPLARALGFSANPPTGQPDGTIYLNTSIMNLSQASTVSSDYSLFSTVSHEIDEVLAFSSALNGLTNGAPAPTGAVFPEDLFRYDGTGARSFTTASNAAAYFSLDGINDIARFNQYQGGDYQDWYSYYGGQTPEVQDAFGTAGSSPVLGAELRVLDAVGFTRVVPQATIVASAGTGGTISPSGTFTKSVGLSQSFTATPDTTHFVSQWLVDSAVAQTGGTTYTLVNIQTNHSVQVTFLAKTNQTITFNPLVSKNYGDAPFTVNATASSGLAVSFTILSGPASISGNTITITGTGTVVVQASQAGNSTYNAATNVNQSFTVNPASQTIAFGSLSNKTYGDPSFPLTATASSGLPVAFSIVSGPATIAGTNLTITGAGNVTVQAAQAGNTNYSAAPNVNQSFTVNPASQMVNFGSLLNRTYGDAPFTVSATASSGLAVSFSILSGPATISGNTVTITGAGPVTVQASQAGNANYSAAATVNQSFTVNPASQTIAFASLPNKTYGDPAFPLTATASSGLAVNFSIVSGPATISGTNLTITGAGNVTVQASQAGNTNYNAAINVNQSFSVAKAAQTIIFAALPSVALGEPPYTLSASASSGLPVAFNILSGPATISSATVTFTNTGAVVIEASQSGNNNYNAATNVTETLLVYSPPALSLLQSGTNIVISWKTNVSGFSLLSATNLGAAGPWLPVLPSPVIVNGQYVVTNGIAGGTQFYQLKK